MLPRPPRRRRASFLSVALAGVLSVAGCAEAVVPEVQAPTIAPEPSATPVVAPTPTTGPGAGTPTPPPASSVEPGLSAERIRVAVIADVGAGTIGDQLNASAWQAVEAWAASVNAGGGLVGRQVEVVTVDTGLFDHGTAISEVCAGDVFALVGSVALLDADGLEVLADPGCDLPDFPGVASTPERQQFENTFVSNPVNGRVWNAGSARFHVVEAPEGAAAVGSVLLDLPVAVVAGERMIEATTAQGYSFVYDPVVPFDADVDVVAADLVDRGVRAITWSADGDRILRLLTSLRAIGAQLSFVDCASACYSPRWVAAAQEVGVTDGVSVALHTVPFEEAGLSAELSSYLFWLGRVAPGASPSATGVASWAGARLFQEAVERAVGLGRFSYDPDRLTRRAVVDAARTITAWDGHGLHGVANPAEGIPSACVVVATLTDGRWQRVHPAGPGSFDCDPGNLVTLVDTAELTTMVEAAAEAVATPTPAREDG